jgi:hypothetical protein
MKLWFLMALVGCSGGLQTTMSGCEDGYERGDDGSCYLTDADDDGEFDDSCDSPADCTDDKCPDGSMGCTCLMEAGICAPTCNTDADCPDLEEEVFECNDDGICDLPIED